MCLDVDNLDKIESSIQIFVYLLYRFFLSLLSSLNWIAYLFMVQLTEELSQILCVLFVWGKNRFSTFMKWFFDDNINFREMWKKVVYDIQNMMNEPKWDVKCQSSVKIMVQDFNIFCLLSFGEKDGHYSQYVQFFVTFQVECFIRIENTLGLGK